MSTATLDEPGRRFLVATLRVAALRARLRVIEIDQLGIALASGCITLPQAVAHAASVGLDLPLLPPDDGGGND